MGYETPPGDNQPPANGSRPTGKGNQAVTSDKLVVPQDVLDAILEIRRQGVNRLVREMETQEPSLAKVFLEESTNIHFGLSRIGLRPRRFRALNDRIQSFGLTLVRSLRCAQLRLWDEEEQAPIEGRGAKYPIAEPESE